mmetsp:Transcript_18115/g.33652  ORF Transcript_18115/g.33652 Transcript_18115/m.33652 type:complete len:273 (+) Transcript_18115:92-910(+)
MRPILRRVPPLELPRAQSFVHNLLAKLLVGDPSLGIAPEAGAQVQSRLLELLLQCSCTLDVLEGVPLPELALVQSHGLQDLLGARLVVCDPSCVVPPEPRPQVDIRLLQHLLELLRPLEILERVPSLKSLKLVPRNERTHHVRNVLDLVLTEAVEVYARGVVSHLPLVHSLSDGASRLELVPPGRHILQLLAGVDDPAEPCIVLFDLALLRLLLGLGAGEGGGGVGEGVGGGGGFADTAVHVGPGYFFPPAPASSGDGGERAGWFGLAFLLL